MHSCSDTCIGHSNHLTEFGEILIEAFKSPEKVEVHFRRDKRRLWSPMAIHGVRFLLGYPAQKSKERDRLVR